MRVLAVVIKLILPIRLLVDFYVCFKSIGLNHGFSTSGWGYSSCVVTLNKLPLAFIFETSNVLISGSIVFYFKLDFKLSGGSDLLRNV